MIMARFRKAIVAALLAGASILAPFVSDGVNFNEILLTALAALVTGVATYGVKNAGFTELAPVADLAEAAYTEYRRVRGGLAYDGSPLPEWSELETTIRSAWERGQTAAANVPAKG
jgi:hypothetical protein